MSKNKYHLIAHAAPPIVSHIAFLNAILKLPVSNYVV